MAETNKILDLVSDKDKNKIKRAERIRKREINDVRVLLGTVEGRRFYWRLLAECGVFRESYVAGDNGQATFRNLGRRSIGLWAMDELLISKPDVYQQMLRERASELAGQKREEEEENES